MEERRLSRRSFLGYSAGVSLLSAAAKGSPPGVAFTETPDLLWEALNQPPLDCRPKTRWWWYGGAVTQAEIGRELQSMRDAGIGGAEIQPVYPVAVDDPDNGILNVPFFSSRWYDLLGFALRRGHELGLEIDLTLGSGWPFGGPFVELDQAARRIRILTRDFGGPAKISWDPAAELGEGERIATITARRMDDPVEEPPSRILGESEIGQLGSKGLEVGPGRWRFYAAIDAPTYMQVKRPTLGMEGYVIDHFARPSLDLFLKATGERTLDELAARHAPVFDNVFCDSLEVYGADWTPALFEEFEKRRGYPLSERLHLLIESAGEAAERVRFDYHQTLSELTLENFFERLADWCKVNEIPSRVQAHGAMGDIMKAYGTVDIPEGETIFGGDVNKVNIRHRRLASSAAHVYSKPIVSAETYTWLRMPMFMVNLEMMKAATDAAFLDGINQIVNHGYSYSPPQVVAPGWQFYASTHINPTNTWWRHYPHLSAYVRRCASVLRRGNAVNRVAIYIPLADILSRKGIGGFHFDEAIEQSLGEELVEGLRKAGFDFDFLNDDALTRLARIESGKLVIGTGRYEAVILPEVQSIPLETFRVLNEFNQAGGYLGFYKRIPDRVPGLADFHSRQQDLATRLSAMGVRPEGTGSNGTGRWSATAGLLQLIQDLSRQVSPDLRILETQDGSLADARADLGFTRRLVDGRDVFFLANVGPRLQSLKLGFGVGHRKPRRLDPMSLERRDELIYDFEKDPDSDREITRVNLELEPFEACFLEFSSGREPLIRDGRLPRSLSLSETGGEVRISGFLPHRGEYTVTTRDGRVHRLQRASQLEPLRLSGPWTLQPEGRAARRLERLQSWIELEGLRDFSGWANYTASFRMEALEPNLRWIIDLGEVFDTAEVEINGSRIGDAWKRPRRLDCTSALQTGLNQLTIRVANLWIHHIIATPPPDHSRLATSYGIRWGRYGEVPPDTIPPAGLLGPVRLIPEQQIDQRIL
ncbi:MAG: glycosyl hydrolase [Acidobacteriota bacterium]